MAVFGFLVGISFPVAITPKLQCGILPWSSSASSVAANSSSILDRFWAQFRNSSELSEQNVKVARKPEGAERLPAGIVVPESDLHLRRLWGSPTEDVQPRKYLLALAAGYTERANVNATVHKFSDNFDIVLFHYDGRTTEWDDEFRWSEEAVHVSAKKQTKWWFAKRFLHPSIVAPYEYVFLWDEDLGVDNFTAEAYVEIVRRHGLEISQPGLDAAVGPKTYDVSIKRDSGEIHKTDAGGPRCPDVHQMPCSGFVEVMAPVFSRDAWRCVWHMIQNDLVHGWGLDFNFWRCVNDPEEQIGVVDAQFVVHRGVPTLIAQGNGEKEGSSHKVRARQFEEMYAFNQRIAKADNATTRTLPDQQQQP
ncbi:uncharacterized protein LOC100822695 [Brachypodium distachyon]|nr:uncharacterized protein LOC100822695 [Brachypodium distachyon]|eukprot:XP_014751447.1 uncharacterized protein LOC100822695 [Brachypodium distachyon]